MPYDQDPRVLDWFERALGDARPRVRRRAVELLRYVECAPRHAWLARAEIDADPEVSAQAVLVSAAVATESEAAIFEVLESDLAEGLGPSDLVWEWEYCVRICRQMLPSSTGLLVWTQREDDAAAKERALMKVFPTAERESDAVPVIVAKRLVNQYTRSPRSMVEALNWQEKGRPRYRGG